MLSKPELVFGNLNNLKGRVIIYAHVINTPDTPSDVLTDKIDKLLRDSSLEQVLCCLTPNYFSELKDLSHVYGLNAENLLAIKNKALMVIASDHIPDIEVVGKTVGIKYKKTGFKPGSFWRLSLISPLSDVYQLFRILNHDPVNYDLVFSGFYSSEAIKKDWYSNRVGLNTNLDTDLGEDSIYKDIEARIMALIDAHESLYDAGNDYYKQYEQQATGVLVKYVSKEPKSFEDMDPHYFLRYGRFWEEFVKPLMFLSKSLKEFREGQKTQEERSQRYGIKEINDYYSDYYIHVISLYHLLGERFEEDADMIIKSVTKALDSEHLNEAIGLVNLVIDKLRAVRLGKSSVVEDVDRLIKQKSQALF